MCSLVKTSCADESGIIGASSDERARRPARHASQCLKDAAPDYLRFFELSGVWYIMFGNVAPQHTMQKASYFVMLAGLYRKPSPLTCAPRAVPGDGGGGPAIDAVRGIDAVLGRRAWCPPWSCCTPGPSFGPWARRQGCPAGKFHLPRPWPCLMRCWAAAESSTLLPGSVKCPLSPVGLWVIQEVLYLCRARGTILIG